MRILAVASTLLLVGLTAVVAQEERKDGVSPSGKIGWHVVKVGDNGASEVLISEAAQEESAPKKLCEAISIANTDVSIAPDDSWIIVQTGGASLGVSLITFRRENGMIYNEEKEVDIGAAVLLSACGGDQKKADSMDHIYADARGWSENSKSLLVEMNAKGESGRVESFFAIYDLVTKKDRIRSGEAQ